MGFYGAPKTYYFEGRVHSSVTVKRIAEGGRRLGKATTPTRKNKTRKGRRKRRVHGVAALLLLLSKPHLCQELTAPTALERTS